MFFCFSVRCGRVKQVALVSDGLRFHQLDTGDSEMTCSHQFPRSLKSHDMILKHGLACLKMQSVEIWNRHLRFRIDLDI